MKMGAERLTKKQVANELTCCPDHSPKEIKKVANNTFRVTYHDDRQAIRYHHTDVITRHVNGCVELTSGGYMTPTTKERLGYLREFAPGFSIYQKNKIWYLCKGNWSDDDRQEYTFADGITIMPDGNVTGAGDDPKAILKLDRRIKKYVKGYIDKLFSRTMEKPGGGDCFYCQMQVEGENISLGEKSKNADHILSHIEENYFVPSMVCNAVRAFPISRIAESELGYLFRQHDQTIGGSWGDIARQQIGKSILRFIRRQVGIAS